MSLIILVWDMVSLLFSAEYTGPASLRASRAFSFSTSHLPTQLWDYRHIHHASTFSVGCGIRTQVLTLAKRISLPAERSPQPWHSFFQTSYLDTTAVRLAKRSVSFLSSSPVGWTVKMVTGLEGEFQAVITDQAVAAPGDIRGSPELSHGKG